MLRNQTAIKRLQVLFSQLQISISKAVAKQNSDTSCGDHEGRRRKSSPPTGTEASDQRRRGGSESSFEDFASTTGLITKLQLVRWLSYSNRGGSWIRFAIAGLRPWLRVAFNPSKTGLRPPGAIAGAIGTRTELGFEIHPGRSWFRVEC